MQLTARDNPCSPPLLAALIGNTVSRMARLRLCVGHGVLKIDTSAAEPRMRAIAFGLKNSLFIGAEVGVKAAAITYILIPAYSPNTRFQSARERVGDGFDLFRGFGTASRDGSGVIQAADG